jgi:hypothetical protein
LKDKTAKNLKMMTIVQDLSTGPMQNMRLCVVALVACLGKPSYPVTKNIS